MPEHLEMAEDLLAGASVLRRPQRRGTRSARSRVMACLSWWRQSLRIDHDSAEQSCAHQVQDTRVCGDVLDGVHVLHDDHAVAHADLQIARTRRNADGI